MHAAEQNISTNSFFQFSLARFQDDGKAQDVSNQSADSSVYTFHTKVASYRK